jgi:hypothetical protein
MEQEKPLPEALLAQCPFCDYSLEGLPVEHTCPECGRPFDRRSRVFGAKNRWQRMGKWELIGVAASLVLAIGIWLHSDYRFFRVFGYWRLDWITILVSNLLIGGWLLFKRPRYIVVAGPEQVDVIDRRRRQCDHYPLRPVLRAYVDRCNWLVLETDEDEDDLTGLVGRAEVQRCAEYINSLIQKNRSLEAGRR